MHAHADVATGLHSSYLVAVPIVNDFTDATLVARDGTDGTVEVRAVTGDDRLSERTLRVSITAPKAPTQMVPSAGRNPVDRTAGVLPSVRSCSNGVSHTPHTFRLCAKAVITEVLERVVPVQRDLLRAQDALFDITLFREVRAPLS